MEGTTARLCLFLLLLIGAIHGDQDFSTMQMNTPSSDLENTLQTAVESSDFNTDDTDFFDTNGTRADCLIDTEMGLIAVGSAGGLIVCLLVATVVLACQVCHLQKRVYLPRTSRSNTNLVGGSSYWDADQTDGGGVVGPCDSSVILEEVTTEGKTEAEGSSQREDAKEEASTGLEEGAVAMALLPKEKPRQSPISSSRDYGLEVPRDLEDMPLVV